MLPDFQCCIHVLKGESDMWVSSACFSAFCCFFICWSYTELNPHSCHASEPLLSFRNHIWVIVAEFPLVWSLCFVQMFLQNRKKPFWHLIQCFWDQSSEVTSSCRLSLSCLAVSWRIFCLWRCWSGEGDEVSYFWVFGSWFDYWLFVRQKEKGWWSIRVAPE